MALLVSAIKDIPANQLEPIARQAVGMTPELRAQFFTDLKNLSNQYQEPLAGQTEALNHMEACLQDAEQALIHNEKTWRASTEQNEHNLELQSTTAQFSST